MSWWKDIINFVEICITVCEDEQVCISWFTTWNFNTRTYLDELTGLDRDEASVYLCVLESIHMSLLFYLKQIVKYYIVVSACPRGKSREVYVFMYVQRS